MKHFINCKQFIALVLLMAGVACSSSKMTYGPLSDAEQKAIAKAQKQVPRKATEFYILLMTSKGDIVLKLYNQTPLHRNNFVQKVTSGFYDSLLFHRVIPDFMIQGGDPESKLAEAGAALGNGSAPGDRIPAELRTHQGIYHKRGALAAARNNNPEQASSNCQFYIVQKPVWSMAALREEEAIRGIKLNDEQIKIYTTIGGKPHLDNNYTVFGEAISGMNVVDSIALMPRDSRNRPNENVRMKMFLLNRINSCAFTT